MDRSDFPLQYEPKNAGKVEGELDEPRRTYNANVTCRYGKRQKNEVTDSWIAWLSTDWGSFHVGAGYFRQSIFILKGWLQSSLYLDAPIGADFLSHLTRPGEPKSSIFPDNSGRQILSLQCNLCR